MKSIPHPSRIKFLISFFLCFLAFFPFSSLRAQERTIALVYDDSGSMNTNNANPCNAVNYALQLMVGLLNPEDTLFVVTMNQSTQLQHFIIDSAENKDAQIRDIRTWTCQGNTSFEAAETAMSALESIQDPNQDKWLIIFTDGLWPTSPEIASRIASFATSSGAKTIILNINATDNPIAATFRNTGQADVYNCPASFESIRQNMEQIALSVMSMSQSGITVKINGQNIQITSEFPLKRLILLEQSTGITNNMNQMLTVVKAKDSSGQTIPTNGIYNANIPQQITGRVTHLLHPHKNGVIQAGNMDISLSAPIDSSRIKFLPQVAAKLQAKATGPNILHTKGNVYQICNDQKEVTIEAELIGLDGNALSPLILKKTMVWIHCNHTKTAMNIAGPVFKIKIPVTAPLTPVSVSAVYPGYFNFRTNVFSIEKIFCKPPDKATLKQNDYPTYKVTELDKAPFLTLIPLINNTPATAAQFKDLSLCGLENATIDVEIQAKDSYWLVRPKAKWGIPCFTRTGIHRISLDLKSSRIDLLAQSGPTTIVFDIRDVCFICKCLPFVIGVLLVVFLLWYILGVLKKPRFCRGSEIVYQRLTQFVKNKELTFQLKGKLMDRFFIPYLPETAQIQGIKFKAGRRCGYIELPKESQSERMFISGNLIEDPGKRDQRISNGDELLIELRNHKETYKYSKI